MKQLYLFYYNKLIAEGHTTRFKGSHRHRILPGFEGGIYEEANEVYLTKENHSLIHWLRWKLFGKFEDRKAWKMIGVGPKGLSHSDRVQSGLKAKANKTGFHSMTPEERRESSLKGVETQKELYQKEGDKNFYYWSTEAGRKERASKGGKASCEVNQAFIEQQGAFSDKEHARTSGKKSGKKPITNGKIIKKLKTEEEVEAFLEENKEWRRGYLTKKEKSALAKLKNC